MLAELPQMTKQKKWRLRSFRKWQNRKNGACGASANSKTKNLALAELPQIAKQKIWRLRSFRIHLSKVEPCRGNEMSHCLVEIVTECMVSARVVP